ncbi:MAG TPA: branched-chain amino acid ABC transporter permease [Symbiobacteriaceae bacterium]|nr:branched-chain amino acid ABC transporter permease [Symbiobacteriaceae bacterium]
MRSKAMIAVVATPVLYLLLEYVRRTGIINAYWAQIMDLSLIITISALGLSLIYGFAGQFSLGHAAFYGIGAYAGGLITQKMGGTQFWFAVALLTGAATAGLLAYLIGLPILRLKSDYLGIATLGFGVIVKVMMDNTDKFVASMGGSRGMLGIPRMASFAWIFWLAVAMILLARNLVNSAHGRAWISVREDETSADIMGINTTHFKTMAFVLGCSMAGLAGALYSHRYPFLHPSSFDFLKSFDVLLVVVLGGLGSITGTVVTAVAWVFLLEWLREVLPQNLLDWRGVIYALLLIVMMILRPQGLLGGKELTLVPEQTATPPAPKQKEAKKRASA